MSGLAHRGILRWKEWTPLVTQQLRLRSLIQISAYNVRLDNDILKISGRKKLSYYFTLHLTTMSSPFYTSEQLESENPKWAEIDVQNSDYGSANGVVIRLWAHCSDEEDDIVITVWGVYFSGLMYIGSRLGTLDPGLFSPNSFVLHLQGGYFTAPRCLLNPQPLVPRAFSIQISSHQVKPSYTLKRLLTIQSLKHAIKKETEATIRLREEISASMLSGGGGKERENTGRGSATLRKLLSRQAPPKPDPHLLHQVKQEIEIAKFRVRLLAEQRDLVQVAVQKKLTEKNAILEKNQDRESVLMENFCCLRREGERKRDARHQLTECKSQLAQTSALLDVLRKELISRLSDIYPILQLPEGKFTIRDVHLPNSEDFDGKDELMVSVALGFAAHLVQMISYFLDIPTRYPICHFGSRSKIIDHITDNIPDKEREFPLYSRGKERHSFNYGVYLLNKNIAQLRWCCGLTTSDLRHTLPNLLAIMTLNKKDDLKKCLEMKRNKKKSGLSQSLDGGLDVGGTPNAGVCSDPQQYTAATPPGARRRAQTDRGPPPRVHDLASLMSLGISPQERGRLSDEGRLEGAVSDSDLETNTDKSLDASRYMKEPLGNPRQELEPPPAWSSDNSFSSSPEKRSLENVTFKLPENSSMDSRNTKDLPTLNVLSEASLNEKVFTCDNLVDGQMETINDSNTIMLTNPNLVDEKT